MTQTQKAPPPDAFPFAPLGADEPLLPSRSAAGSSTDDALRDLRRFHFGLGSDASPTPSQAAAGYLPALLYATRSGEWPAGDYPVFLPSPEAVEPASCVSLPDLLSRASGAEAAPEAKAGPAGLDQLAGRVCERLAGRQAPADARQLLEEAGQEAGDLEGWLAAVPAGASLLPESEQAPLHLLMQAARCRWLPARTRLRAEVRSLAAEAQALLAADRQKQPESRSSGSVDGSLGSLGSRFVDPSALAGMLDQRSGGTALPPGRRQGLEDALAAFEEYLAAEAAPALVLVHDGEHGIEGCDALPPGAGGWRVELRDDPCAAAAEVFDRESEAVARVLRAVRRVRLEAEGKYDPERLDPWLERFDWQAFSRQELSMLTPVAALVSADRIAGAQMASLSGLLRSGRPVQVLVPVAPTANPGTEGGTGSDPRELAGFRFEPAYLGLAHREALVQQTSTASPGHMLRGFSRALVATHAGLHVVSASGVRRPEGEDGDSEGAPAGHGYHAAALEARAHPFFLYDPESGSSWAERFDFSLNPQAKVDWPLHTLPTRRPDGSREELELAFTFADFALLEPAYGHHFQPVPEGVPEVELVPAAEYSAKPPDDEAAIPYVWAVDEASKLARLAISRPLALACRDRLDFWRTLQELSGARSEHVRRAEARLREEHAEQTSSTRAQLEARHAEELERVRHDAARDVVDRLTAALLEVDLAAFAAPVPAPLAGLAGGSVDDVAAALLQLVDPSTLDRESAEPGSGEEVDRVASELLDICNGLDA